MIILLMIFALWIRNMIFPSPNSNQFLIALKRDRFNIAYRNNDSVGIFSSEINLARKNQIE